MFHARMISGMQTMHSSKKTMYEGQVSDCQLLIIDAHSGFIMAHGCPLHALGLSNCLQRSESTMIQFNISSFT